MHPEDIKAALRKSGVSMAEIARRLVVSRTAVGAVVDGSSRSQRVEAAIAEVLQLSPATLWPNWYEALPGAFEIAAVPATGWHAQGQTAEAPHSYGAVNTGQINLSVLRATLRACSAALKQRFGQRAAPDPEFLTLVYNRIARLDTYFHLQSDGSVLASERFAHIATEVLTELLPDGDELIDKVARPC